jgi:PAS domain S-box-containing protein
MRRTLQVETKTAAPAVSAVLAHVLDDLPDGLLLVDENWRITYANLSARHISHLPSDHLGRSLWELYPDTPLGHVYREVMETRIPRILDAYYHQPFGLWLELHIMPAGAGLAVHYRDVSTAQRAEQDRRQATDRLEQVLAATSDGVIALDREFRVTYMNRRAHEMLAPSRDILGQNLFESFPSAVYENSPWIEHYHRAMNERVPSGFEAFYPQPLNLWFNVVARPSPDGIIIFFRDITEEKARNEALRASEERYRILAELSPLSQWTANPEGLVLYANQRFLEYIGHDKVPRTGTEYIACFAEQDRAHVVEVWSHSVATGAVYDIEARLLRASDGAARWWHLRALPVRDDSGAIQQWLGTAIDIHETRTAADQMRAQYAEIDRRRRELETIYNGSPIGMALYDPKQLRLLRLNDRQAEIFRLAAADAIGKHFVELTAGVPSSHPLILRAAAGENVLNHEVEGVLNRRTDEYRYWNVNYSPIFSEDGSVQAIAAATIETTQHRRAEAALMQSEKLAAVGRMASSIAHEINNPLESVTNLLYIARQNATSPQMQEFLDLANQELRRVSVIVNQTLRFHKQSTLPSEITCNELISTVLSLYEGRLRNCDITVEKRKRTRRPIACFEGDIRQVLNNLVANAIDAMPKGGRLLLRSREATDWRPSPGLGAGPDSAPPRRGLVLTIADTGSGISADTRARIFEPFFTTKGMNGTGLGLWISAEIVDRHRGRLALRSSQREGRHGTVFTLFLPFNDPFPKPTQLPN